MRLCNNAGKAKRRLNSFRIQGALAHQLGQSELVSEVSACPCLAAWPRVEPRGQNARRRVLAAAFSVRAVGTEVVVTLGGWSAFLFSVTVCQRGDLVSMNIRAHDSFAVFVL